MVDCNNCAYVINSADAYRNALMKVIVMSDNERRVYFRTDKVTDIIFNISLENFFKTYESSTKPPKHGEIWRDKSNGKRVIVLYLSDNGYVHYVYNVEDREIHAFNQELGDFILVYERTGEKSEHLDGLVKEFFAEE